MNKEHVVLERPAAFEPVETAVPCLSCGRPIVAKNEYALDLLEEYSRGYCDGCRSAAIEQGG